MLRRTTFVLLAIATGTSGCASFDFNTQDEARDLLYFEPKPYLFVSTDKDCNSTATVVMIPEKERRVHLKSGYGASKLSLELTNGMITSVGQETTSGVSETFASLGALAAGLGAQSTTAPPPGVVCPSAKLYPVTNGEVQVTNAEAGAQLFP